MIRFLFEQLLDEENIFNLEKEKKALSRIIANRERVFVYAPRNYGKTSLVRNVVIPQLKKTHKYSFFFFTDLMEVKDMSSLVGRLKNSFESSFADPLVKFYLCIYR